MIVIRQVRAWCFVFVLGFALWHAADAAAAAESGSVTSTVVSDGARYHQTQFQQQQAALSGNYLGPASMQYMAMNHDGQYRYVTFAFACLVCIS